MNGAASNRELTRSAVDPPFDDKLTGRRGYHAGHASVAGKIGSPCKMSSDRRASDIYARGKHYDPNCQYRYICHVISQNGIRRTDVVVADKKAPAGVLVDQEKGSGGLRANERIITPL